MSLPQVVPNILRFDSVVSTQEKLRELAALGRGEGTVIVAKRQSKGRGRMDRGWHSPQGGLYLSLLIYPENKKRLTDLSLLAGAVLSQTVKHFLPNEVGVRVGVKWPNDCLINGQKVGGVLCEVVTHGIKQGVIIGVGLNLNIPHSELVAFSERPFQATSLSAHGLTELEKRLDSEIVLQRYLENFFKAYETYQKEGFYFLQKFWERECLFIGKKLELRETGLSQEKTSSPVFIQGTFLGIDEQGALVLSNSQGDRQSYMTGEITCYWS